MVRASNRFTMIYHNRAITVTDTIGWEFIGDSYSGFGGVNMSVYGIIAIALLIVAIILEIIYKQFWKRGHDAKAFRWVCIGVWCAMGLFGILAFVMGYVGKYAGLF